MLRIILTIGLSLLVLTGCSHLKPQKVYQPTGLTASGLWKDQQRRRDEMRSLSAKLKLTYHGRKDTVSGDGRMLLQPVNKIRLEIRDPFGRIHYLVTVNGSNFLAYYPQQKLAYFDERSGNAYVLDFLGFDFAFVDLQDVLLGILPEKARGELSEWKWNGESGQYEAAIRNKVYDIRCSVDGQKGFLRQVVLRSSNREVQVRYSDFEPYIVGKSRANPLSVARTVELDLRLAKTRLEVEWEKLDALDALRPDSAFQVKLDGGVEKISLK